mmetsp:Transcript_135847/g.434632  ORF Transcript_135847/g.434632 Transcript_135847/m.434632 type:complete len:1300 (+) Transcript_135847:161-4060(+)
MSEVYIKEPNTNGKAIFRTTHGDLEIELWATECPKACRNFCQLILEGYYNDTIFHRVIRDFIIQGGDQTNTGDGSESIYGKPYPDEIHPRLKFRYRGMMGVASAGKGTNTNGSQFFIVLDRAPTLDGKHTLFGKVVGQTVYNLVRMSEVECDKKDRPMEAPRILRAELVWDPFGDLEPRKMPEPPKSISSGPAEVHRRAPVKNKKVLSFGEDEGDSDEDAPMPAAKKGGAHDLLADPKLLKDAAYPDAVREREKSSKRPPPADEKGSASGVAKRAAVLAAASSGSRSRAVAPEKGSDDDEDDDSDASSGADGTGTDVAKLRSYKRQEAINQLKREIAGVGSEKKEEKQSRKTGSALEELRAGYQLREARVKATGKEGKRKAAEDMVAQMKSFRSRVKSLTAPMPSDGEEEEGEEKSEEDSTNKSKDKKEKKKEKKEKKDKKNKQLKSKDNGGSTTTVVSTGLLDTLGAFLGARQEATTLTTNSSASGPIRWRADMQCGKKVAGDDGKPGATCDPEGESPCCSVSGWCGNLDGHCKCDGCVDYRAPQSQRNLSYSETRPKRIALIVPFRDREAHLQRFRDRIASHVSAWNQKGIRHDWTVYVVEQFDNDLFNRGYLFNVGFRDAMEHAKRSGKPYDCVVMHDIDILPEAVVDYGWCLWPNQLSGEIECWSWSAPYPDNVGGVVSLSPAHWNQINGFSNEYDGWGGEDDDLYLRLKQNSLLKGGCHTWCGSRSKPKIPVVHRPPLGEGRFNCLHDGDHTPRQRAPNDSQMWKRLNEMKAGSKRWNDDGLTSLTVHEAGLPLEAFPCSRCAASEDPTPKLRLFSEYWTRVSQKRIESLSRLHVLLPPGHACSNLSVPLHKVPQGLEELRLHLSVLFPTECALSGAWLSKLSFALIDLTLGQVLLLGKGAGIGVPDSSLPPLQSAAGEGQWTKVKQDAEQQASTHMMQSQRLVRWIRRIPEHHHGWIVAIDEPLPDLRKRFVDDSRHVQVLSPLCISAANFEGGKKFRATPGTQWCGDNGWSHSEFFNLMRSSDSVPKDQAVGICISLNPAKFTYRFELSESGCIGKSSGIDWVHAQTVHTSKDARGAPACIGVLQSGASTRWTMRLRAKCNSDGFTHTHSFRTMIADGYATALMRACLVSSSPSGSFPERRLVSGHNCDKDVSSDNSMDVWFLAGRRSEKDFRLCTARGQLEAASAQQPELWRVFWNAACEKQTFVTRDSQDRKLQWTVSQDPPLYVPEDADGAYYCLCEIITKAEGDLVGGLLSYSWFNGACPAGAQRELCLRALSTKDILRFSSLVDDVT